MLLSLTAILPFIFAAATLLRGCRADAVRARMLLAACGCANLALVAWVCVAAFSGGARLGGMRGMLSFGLDDGFVQAAVVAASAALFFAASLHSAPWLAASRAAADSAKMQRDSVYYCGLLCAFAGAMNLAALADNAGFLWVAMEATTLLSAPLLIFHRSAKSLDALWKYLLACSVGIGFALFGTMLAAQAAEQAGADGLGLREMAAASAAMNPGWFKAAFVFVLAGYGTKMGLAPFHAWLPSAYPAAPAPAAAFMSGALVNCSFLAIWRFAAMAPAPAQQLCRDMMLALGLISLAAAALAMLRETDCARMLAHSSTEQMGLVIIMAALGVKLLPLHLFFHAFLKASLFMAAGCVLLECKSRSLPQTRGMFARRPFLAALLACGILALCAAPPSPLFFTELALIREAGLLLGGATLFFLFVIFCAMCKMAISMTTGAPPAAPPPLAAQVEKSACGWKLLFAPAALLALALTAGVALCFLAE